LHLSRWITLVVLVTILSACEETPPPDQPPETDSPELTGTVWVLESLVQGESVSDVGGERATLELFSDGSMLGSTGCRALNGRYTIAGVEVTMAELSAHGDCPVELRDQDAVVVRVLGDGFRVEVDDEILTLTTGNEGLAYRAAP
jgi:heat shock protein HslJ